ncbi:MAG: hypothetical protein LWX83_05930 [Anaerolineae bacterium]|nr:hypothetical protein [Anaerolineae bacterium]
MKRIFLAIVLIGSVAAALAASPNYVYAQTPTPTATVSACAYGTGWGMGSGGMMGSTNTGGFLHDEMLAAFAGKLDLTVEALQARLDQGATISQIACEKGMTLEQFVSLMNEARTQALKQAVNNGKISQQQADWMSQRGGGMMGGFARGGGGPNARGGFAVSGCPRFAQP